MFGLALTLTALTTTTWTYAGFVANPPAPPPSVALTTSPIEPVWPGRTPDLPRRPSRPAALLAPSVRYQMADASGQVWEHADPATLQAFVLEQNARLTSGGAVPRYLVMPRKKTPWLRFGLR